MLLRAYSHQPSIASALSPTAITHAYSHQGCSHCIEQCSSASCSTCCSPHTAEKPATLWSGIHWCAGRQHERSTACCNAPRKMQTVSLSAFSADICEVWSGPPSVEMWTLHMVRRCVNTTSAPPQEPDKHLVVQCLDGDCQKAWRITCLACVTRSVTTSHQVHAADELAVADFNC